MKLSVLIPTYRRPTAIDQCLAHLAAQECPCEFEIIVGIDGYDGISSLPSVPASIEHRTGVVPLDRMGLIGVRRTMLDLSRGELVLWLNDDAYAYPGLLQTHLSMHNHAAPCVVAGAARWKPIPDPNPFDRLVQETDLVFFRQRAEGDKPIPTDYRNCFGLNMSFPRRLVEEVGGLPEMPECYGYEDIELAYRLAGAGAELFLAPRAVVTHDHRYRAADVHRREYLLGRSAWHFAGFNPDFARDLFRRDIRSRDELEYAREALIREHRDALRIERTFLSIEHMPMEHTNAETLHLMSEHWVLLKRYLWRWGLLDAAQGVPSRWSLLSDQSPPIISALPASSDQGDHALPC